MQEKNFQLQTENEGTSQPNIAIANECIKFRTKHSNLQVRLFGCKVS